MRGMKTGLGGKEHLMALDFSADYQPREAVREALDAGRTVACFHGILCAHRSVLELLMASLVDVSMKEMGDDNDPLRQVCGTAWNRRSPEQLRHVHMWPWPRAAMSYLIP